MLAKSLPPALEAKLGPAYEVPARATIFRQGDSLKAVLFIEDGYVKTVESYDDRDLIVSVRPPGWILGAISALSGEAKHLLGAESLSPCTLRPVRIDLFLRLVRQELSVSASMAELMACEAADNLRLGALCGTRAAARLEALLVHLARLNGRRSRTGAIQIMVPLQRQEIAQMLGIRPGPCGNLLKELGRKALIQVVDGRVTIPPTSRLIAQIGVPSGPRVLWRRPGPPFGLDTDEALTTSR